MHNKYIFVLIIIFAVFFANSQNCNDFPKIVPQPAKVCNGQSLSLNLTSGTPYLPPLVFNELYDVDGFDANGDGTVMPSGSDRFIEMVNTKHDTLNISGWRIIQHDPASDRLIHEFPANSDRVHQLNVYNHQVIDDDILHL